MCASLRSIQDGAAMAGGVGQERGVPASDPSADLVARAMRALPLAVGAALGVLSLVVVVQRFRYRIDGEWMTGAIRDGVDRLRDGQPLYAAPSARFVPFVYPPLYFWVCAALARICSTFIACKLVSIAATVAAGWERGDEWLYQVLSPHAQQVVVIGLSERSGPQRQKND